MKNLLTKNKLGLLVVVIASGILLLVQPVAAGWAANILAGLLSVIISAVGYIIGLVIEALIYVAQYSDFTHSATITRGWVVVRDLSNMFFVLIMLIISFATILHIESYSFKKYLPKLLLMAILINFSKTIAGLFIDFAQIIMLTFVNGFKDIGAGNLTNMLGLKDILSLNEESKVDFWTVAAAYFLGLFYVIIALVMITAMLATLVMRIVMIWIYVVLSPLAFLLGAFPGGQKYFSQWWGGFSKELIIGPVLAFFIWLSFVSVPVTSDGTDVLKVEGANLSSSELSQQTAKIQQGAVDSQNKKSEGIPTDAAKPETFIRFIVSVGLLLGGLMISKQVGAGAGAAMNKTVSGFQRGGQVLAGGARRLAAKPINWAGRNLREEGWALKENALTGLTKATKFDFRIGKKLKRKQLLRRTELERKADQAEQVVLGNIDKKPGSFSSRMSLLSRPDLAWLQFKNGRFFKSQSKIRDSKSDLDTKEQTYNTLSDEFNNMASPQEVAKNNERTSELVNERSKLDYEKHKLEGEISSTQDPDEKKKKTERVEELNIQISSIEDEIKDVKSSKKVRATQKEYDDKKAEVEQAADNFARAQEDHNTLYGKNAWVGLDTARVSSEDMSESLASRKIAGVNSVPQMIKLFLEAQATKDHAMIRALLKKFVKTYNYNEIMSSLGYGTGPEDVIKFADKELKEKAGFSNNSALSLVAEMGEMGKDIGHFQMFNVAENVGGEWQYASEDDASAARLAEMSKVQIQSIIRNWNRLSIGRYKKTPHGTTTWEMDPVFALLVGAKDKAFSDEIAKTGNLNLIMHIGSDKRNLDIMRSAGANQFADTIEDLVAKAKSGGSAGMIIEDPKKAVQDFNKKIANI